MGAGAESVALLPVGAGVVCTIWIAEGHVTCNIQCLNGRCKHMVDVRLDTLPLDRAWSRIGWCLVCVECGAAGSVNIVPNWHDMKGRTVPFTAGWKTRPR